MIVFVMNTFGPELDVKDFFFCFCLATPFLPVADGACSHFALRFG